MAGSIVPEEGTWYWFGSEARTASIWAWKELWAGVSRDMVAVDGGMVFMMMMVGRWPWAPRRWVGGLDGVENE